MNRYKTGGASKASASTLCQKCLKRGHYSYDCTAAQQDRPYVSRPSRTQQLLNPKLAPKITEAATKAEQPKRIESSSAHSNRKRGSEEPQVSRKRSRSMSTSSSDSVSTISTNLSRSRSRSPPGRAASTSRGDRHGRTIRRDSGSQDRHRDSRPRRSESISSNDSGPRSPAKSQPKRGKDGRRSRSPSASRFDGPIRKSRSRSPYRDRRSTPNAMKDETRKRSLSPYSRRLALSRGTRANA